MSRAQRIAFVSPRFSAVGTVGGAETLLKNLALRAVRDGREVTFLTTCAEDHFTWENARPPGEEEFEGIRVRYFPVDARDAGAYLKSQVQICRGKKLTEQEEMQWMRNSVNSTPLYDHIRGNANRYDRIVAGPYLFGVVYFAAQIFPEKTVLVPCLHDEGFAHIGIMKRIFENAGAILFNTDPERNLARRLFPLRDDRCSVVGMGIDPFDADPTAFARRHGMNAPYVVYSGRREGGKGTPLLCDYMLTFRERTGRDVKLVFTGRGDIPAAPALKPHVIDLGFVGDQEKREAMAGGVAFIHPSTFESLGIVLLESWMAGTPALVHAKGEVLSWQCRQSNGGLWFQSYPEFEQELLLLLERPDLRDALGQNGRRYVLRQYSWESVDQRMFAALDRDA